MTTVSRFLTVAELARQLGLTEETIRHHIKTGVIPAARIGPRQYRVDRGEFERWLEDSRVARAE